MKVYVRNLGGTPIIADVATLVNGVLAVDGIKFPATQVPSGDPNTLDDYEEGTFTPTLTFATPGDLSVVYLIRVGVYTKIGRVVIAAWTVVTSTFTHTTASGTAQISGLPFTSANVADQFAFSVATVGGVTKANYTDFNSRVAPNSSTVDGVAAGSGQPFTTIVAADMPTGGTVVWDGSVPYVV